MLSRNVEYKLIYKMPGIEQRKYFRFDAESDSKALSYAGHWVNNNNAKTYQVEKITRERLV